MPDAAQAMGGEGDSPLTDTPDSAETGRAQTFKSSPDMNRGEVTDALKNALPACKRGVKCGCGNSTWVIGSAFLGNAMLCLRHVRGVSR